MNPSMSIGLVRYFCTMTLSLWLISCTSSMSRMPRPRDRLSGLVILTEGVKEGVAARGKCCDVLCGAYQMLRQRSLLALSRAVSLE